MISPLVYKPINFKLVWISYSQSDDYTSAFLFSLTRTKDNSREVFKKITLHVTCCHVKSRHDNQPFDFYSRFLNI